MQTHRARSGKFVAAAVTLCVVTALAATGLAFMLRQTPPTPAPAPRTGPELPEDLFRGWQRPDLVLLVSGEQHGYLFPCGCSRPQKGGLERRYNLLQALKDKGWPVAAVDLGDVPQKEGPRELPNLQGLIKYRYSMDALKEMDYLAVGVGAYEAAPGLLNVLAEFALNNESPRVLAANVKEREKHFPGMLHEMLVKKVAGSAVTLGVTGTVGPTVQKAVRDPGVGFEDIAVVLPRVLTAMTAQGAELKVLLYQGTLAEARVVAGAHKDFHLIVCLSFDPEPPNQPERVGNTLIVCTGHKGRHVGAVGVWRTGQAGRPLDLRYQVVSLGEEFLTPREAQAKQPIALLMDRYAVELRDKNYLAQYGQMKHPLQVAVPGVAPTFVGTEKCKKCHESAYDIWKDSKHAHAYETLEKAKGPSLRQHDAECIACHVVGFGYETGYTNAERTPHLKDVGCESCHGPGSEHVKNSRDEKWYPLLNPWKPKENETAAEKDQRQLRIDKFCQSCHDLDNDVKYSFKKRWPDVDHPTP